MAKKKIEAALIKAWKQLFVVYPKLKALPVYSWGRYYKYECAGDSFESYVEDSFPTAGIENDIDSDLIDKIMEDQEESIADGSIGDYLPDRNDCVRSYDFDERGGMTLVVVKKKVKGKETLVVEAWSSDSPE